MLNFGRARVLCAIAEHGSFSSAADALGYTQSAVSHQIAAFEREVGLTLVERGVRPARLTQAGTIIAEHARAAAAEMDLAGRRLGDLRGLRTGRLVLGAYPSAYVRILPPAVAQLRRSHPDLDLALAQGEPAELIALLRRGEVDVAVVYSPSDAQPEIDGVEHRRLCRDEFVVLAPPGHLIAGSRSTTLRSLEHEPWIVPSRSLRPDFRMLFERACANSGFDPIVAIEADDPMSAVALVTAGVGLVFATQLVAGPADPVVAVVPLRDGPPPRTLWAATVRMRIAPAVSPAVQALSAAADSVTARSRIGGSVRTRVRRC
jgi:DNA-binding transcriptional LysR family regulator